MSFLNYFKPKTRARLLKGEIVPWIENRGTSKRYITQCCISFPDWADRKELQKIWEDCREIERLTGIKHELDHIIPLNHPLVCGLSVPWNIQIITAKQNSVKGNKFNPYQKDIFEEFV